MEKYTNISFSSCLICAETELCKVHQLPKYSRPYTSQFRENIKTFCEFLALPTPEAEAYENGFAISPLCHVCQERIKLVSSLYCESQELNSNQLDTLRNSIVADLDQEYYFDDDEASPAPSSKAVPLEKIKNIDQDSFDIENDNSRTALDFDSVFYRESGCLYASPAQFRQRLRQHFAELKIKSPVENTLESITGTDASVSGPSASPFPEAVVDLPDLNDGDANVHENEAQITDAVDSITNAWVDQSDFTFHEIEVIDYVEAIVVANPDVEIRNSQDKDEEDAEFIANLLFGDAANSNLSPPHSSQHPDPPKSPGSDVENGGELSDTDQESDDADSDETVLTSDSEKYETDPLKICKKIKNATPSTNKPKPKRVARPGLNPATFVECPYKGRPDSRATCTRLFRDQRRLDAHINRMHLHGKYHQSYKCQYCPVGVTSLKKLEDHEKLHTGTKDSLCSTCGDSFRTEQFLLAHQRKVHGDPYPFVCETCSKGFNYNCHLRIHQLSHTGEFRFRCEKCNAGFQHRSTFNTHKLIHTQERHFQCEQCFATFRSKGALSFHVKKHGEKSWMCDICGKAFWSQFVLKNHKDTHRTDKPFACDKCDYRTKTSTNLRFHVKYTHEGLRYGKKNKDPEAAADSSGRGNPGSARRPRSTRKTKVPARLRQFE